MIKLSLRTVAVSSFIIVAGLLAAVEESSVGATLRLDVRRGDVRLCFSLVAADLDEMAAAPVAAE